MGVHPRIRNRGRTYNKGSADEHGAKAENVAEQKNKLLEVVTKPKIISTRRRGNQRTSNDPKFPDDTNQDITRSQTAGARSVDQRIKRR